MPTPDRITIRRRLALGAVILILAIAVAVLIANSMSARTAGEPAPAVVEGAPPPGPGIATSPLPLPPVPVTRTELIAAAGRASAAYAAGQPTPGQDAELAGRRFLLRIPFGCGGPSRPDAAEPYWTHDADGGTVRIAAPSQVWTKAAWVGELAGSLEFDAVEGFWLPRPWTGSEDCPPEGSAQAGPASPQTLGLAMFFAPDSSRLMRRGGRAYEHVAKAPQGAGPIAPKGYRLKLSGQVSRFADGRPVACHAGRADQRPVCLIAVTFEQIAFEDPATGQTLAEWR